MSYLYFDQKNIDKGDHNLVTKMYGDGYVFTRIDEGVMQKTRSVRVDISKFSLSSENRRILRKTEGISVEIFDIPYNMYDWHIGKIAKDFYEIKFGEKTFSAQKAKETISSNKSNFNKLLVYKINGKAVAYTVCYMNSDIMHYSYPFYDLELYDSGALTRDIGLGMMVRALEHAKTIGLKYAYLGSLQRPGDVYKLQFEGLEWLSEDTGKWETDLDLAKTKITPKI